MKLLANQALRFRPARIDRVLINVVCVEYRFDGALALHVAEGLIEAGDGDYERQPGYVWQRGVAILELSILGNQAIGCTDNGAPVEFSKGPRKVLGRLVVLGFTIYRV
jgi:hypothetical protein